MRLYSLGEVCALFAIDPVTLRRWMRRFNVTPHVDPSDRRRRYLDQLQLATLSEVHHRVIAEMPDHPVGKRLAVLEGKVARLAQQVERLEQLNRSLCVCSPPATKPPSGDSTA